MAKPYNVEQALQRLSDLHAGTIAEDSICWLCGSNDRDVRGVTYRCAVSVKPGEEFEVRYIDPIDGPQGSDSNTVKTQCSCDWHDVKVAA